MSLWVDEKPTNKQKKHHDKTWNFTVFFCYSLSIDSKLKKRGQLQGKRRDTYIPDTHKKCIPKNEFPLTIYPFTDKEITNEKN